MDYLVSDIINSNIPACCLKYDSGVSGQPLIMCGTCRDSERAQVVNSNSLQTRSDSLSMSDSKRGQWSSRVQHNLDQTLPSTDQEQLSDLMCGNRSRNIVSNNSTRSIQLDYLLFCKDQDTRDCSQSHQFFTSSSRSRFGHYNDSCNGHPALDLTANNNSICSNTRLDGQSSWSGSVNDSFSSEDSVQRNVWSTGAKCAQSTLSSISLSPPSFKTQTTPNRVALEKSIITEHEQSPMGLLGCRRKSQRFVPDLDVETPKEVVPVRRELNIPLHPNNNADWHVFPGQRSLGSAYNRHHSTRELTPRTRSSNKTRRSRNTHDSFHLNAPTDQGVRDSNMRLATFPTILAPDFPVPRLLPEEFYDMHDLDHENDDLTTEVVLSLHLRNYNIKEVLGKGISSTVRRVIQKSNGVEYAVKIIDISGEKGEIIHVEQVKKDTFREIHILRMCAGHANIIELHDVFETPTFIFLVFEICKQGELFDYLTSVVSLSEKRTRIFMRQMITAVAYFHEKDIVHRDLKPENILLDDDLNIKVSDFGFATVVQDGEQLSELCGTPGYLAPEVLAHSMYDNVPGYGKEVDMWACGVIMYTLLCGAPPFWNRRQMMMLRAIMSADYTFNSPEWEDITDAPKDLIRKLLVVNPKGRLTAHLALQHPFFQTQEVQYEQYEHAFVRYRSMSVYLDEEMKLAAVKFKARRKFKAGVACIKFMHRLNFYYTHPPPVSVQSIRKNPYGIKTMRKVIDTCAFSMYKHWVKRVDNQNRAALFEHTLRDDWKHMVGGDNVAS